LICRACQLPETPKALDILNVKRGEL